MPPPPLSLKGALELWDMLMLIMYHQIWLKHNEYKYRGDKPPPARIIANSVWNLMELSLRGVLTELATVLQWWVRRADLSFCSHSFAEEKIEAIEEAVVKYRALIYYGPWRLPSQLPRGGQYCSCM